MLEISSILISIIALLFSVVSAWIFNKKSINLFSANHKVKSSIEKSINDYNLNLQKLLVKKDEDDINELDIAENFGYLTTILDLIYPSAKFRISIKLITSDNDSDKLYVKNHLSYAGELNKTAPYIAPVEDNTDFSKIIYEGAEFFFVTDIKEYAQKSEYLNSNTEFLSRWNSSMVFPISKDSINSKTRSIIGFLCIDSYNRLNNSKKNNLIINTVNEIALKLYPILLD